MPEQSNDKIEQFFRKAAARADISFDEADWKKLEARLDAADAQKSAGPDKRGKITATGIGALLIATTIWLSARYDMSLWKKAEAPAASTEISRPDPAGAARLLPPVDEKSNEEAVTEKNRNGKVSADPDSNHRVERTNENESAENSPRAGHDGTDIGNEPGDRETMTLDETTNDDQAVLVDRPMQFEGNNFPADLPVQQVERDLLGHLPVSIERNKQKAVVELPGAEEEQTREVEAMVEEEHASDQTKRMATPRLSLLLSFAPDFSGTSMSFYSSPGKAYGATLHYHPFARWSISAGIIKNHKVYTGDGEDYKPPKGYWKYYTNGIIPETVDGSCSILEFPVMIQYTIVNSGKHKWLAGVGASSYLMQSESYRYNFGTPNPGAKEGWDSKRSSRFMFNMVNITIGYERRILPGLMLGIEPYAKIPLEEIGWSNLRLFSTGASVTLRYTILQKKTFSLPQGRAPD